MGELTTHVLDLARGVPAHGLRVDVHLPTPGSVAVSVSMGESGRPDKPLVDESTFETGRYELVFHLAEYYRSNGVDLTDPPFLDAIVVRVGLATDEHHHVPLLVTPTAYSFYRGT